MSIQAKKLNYTYQIGTPLEHVALKDVSINIEDGSYTAIVGHTGSGKSTLLQHLNGLLKPTSGEISINGYTIDNTTKNKELGKLRKEVGFVFQFPEAQLFEETVLKDIAFAPKNFGKSEDEAEKIAREKAKLVALPEEVLEKSPFELSGGQMRRVAIAGILAMEPKVLVLDEPTAGLDPEGRHQMMEMFMLSYGKTLYSDRLMDRIWGLDSDADISIVWVYISYLRKKLTKLKSNILIKSNRNAGYYLEVIDDKENKN